MTTNQLIRILKSGEFTYVRHDGYFNMIYKGRITKSQARRFLLSDNDPALFSWSSLNKPETKYLTSVAKALGGRIVEI